jgi:phosphohistidine swiveling domain-containing protein
VSRIHPLRGDAAQDPAIAGRKAAVLARLARRGFPIPDGVICTSDGDRSAAAEVIAILGDGPLAVRSSAGTEDGATASWAGQYESILDVRGEIALADAMEAVRTSGSSASARTYGAVESRIPVLIQRQLAPSSAGVAFTADPLSGDLGTCLISATRGLGVALVQGETGGDSWEVSAAGITRRTGTERVLDASDVDAIADLARRVDAELGVGPIDIEWALADGRLWLLQARPMTALPRAVDWTPPLPGAFARNFRLGEWLGDPVTPLFESWLLTRIEHRMHQVYGELIGVQAPGPLHVVVNGWYFYSLAVLPTSGAAIARLLPHVVPRLIRDPRRTAVMLPPIAHLGVPLWEREWREDLLPRYLAAVADAERTVPTLPIDAVPAVIERLATLAGDYFASVTIVAGFAWKAELPLAGFYRDVLRPLIGGSHLDLLQGLHRPAPADHDVLGLDWAHPTLGELAGSATPNREDSRRAALVERRESAEARARSALAGREKELAKFDRLLARAQRSISVREEQLAHFTRPWPVLRRAVLRIGEALVGRGVIAGPADAFFLTRSELLASVAGEGGDLAPRVRERRSAWQRQRRLVPPLTLGALPPMLVKLLGGADAMLRAPATDADVLLRGTPASSGRAIGPVRVVRDVDDFARVRDGDVLVCPATTPAWTQLFGRVAAIVTDTGSPSSHASIVAREFGIPAVVGTGDATARLRDGQTVIVDGAAGTVAAP